MTPKQYNPETDRFEAAPAPAPYTPEGIAFNMQNKETGKLNSMLSERANQPRKAVITCALLFTAGCTCLGGIATYVMTHPQEFPGLFLK